MSKWGAYPKGGRSHGKLIAGVATTAVVCAMAYAPISAVRGDRSGQSRRAESDGGMQAQVKDYAKDNETSWYKRHKMVKKCVQDALAKKSTMPLPATARL